MSHGLISILIPSLNAFRFLEERLDSLLEQTYTDWEAIVLDSQSDDGTWERFCEIADRDPRFKLHRLPREGLYKALNHGIRLAKGKYIHIATCDDTMDPGFLEATVGALSQYPEADIAATDAQFIGPAGEDLTSPFFDGRVRTSIYGDHPDSMNFRPAPHDFFLHYQFASVYYSLTQLLIRREALTETHRFPTDAGSIGDFIWLLNLTRNHSTVHIPRTLATWRIHGDQLSFKDDASRSKNMFQGCRAALADYSPLTKAEKNALMLPARRVFSGISKPFPASLGLYAEGFLYFIGSMLTKPVRWMKGVRAARFGRTNLKQAWVGFLMGMWGTPRPEAVGDQGCRSSGTPGS